MDKVVAFLRRHRRIGFAAFSLLIAFITILFASVSTSPIYVGLNYDNISVDSNFFLLAGKIYASGGTPYIDFYDQKGMYGFSLNALGWLIGGKLGVFFIQVLLAWATVYIITMCLDELGYKLPIKLAVAALYMAGMIGNRAGNHSGELLMPWIALPFYFYIKAIMKREERWFYVGNVFVGVAAGLALNQRASDAMFSLALVIFYFVHWLRGEKKVTSILLNALIVLSSMSLTCLIFFIPAWANGYFAEMWEASVIQSLFYLGNHPTIYRWLFRVCIAVFGILVIIVLVMLYNRANRDYWILLVVNTAVAIPLNILLARQTHYWLSAYPYVLLLFGSLLHDCFDEHAGAKIAKAFSIGLLAVGLSAGGLIVGLNYGSTERGYKRTMEVTSLIERNISKESLTGANGDVVYGIDCNTAIYLLEDIPINCRIYTFQTWWSYDNADIIPETMDYLVKTKPDYLIVGIDEQEITEKRKESPIGQFIDGNYYLLEANDIIAIYQLEI